MGKPFTADPEAPEKAMARLIKSELGIDIAPEALRILIRAKWNRIQGLAHAIHGSGCDDRNSEGQAGR